MLLDLHTDFSGGRSGGLVFTGLEEFSTVCCDPHSKGFGVVNKAEVDVFLELSCFLDDPMNVGNLISGSSAFSKSSLNIWKFLFLVLLELSQFQFKCRPPWKSDHFLRAYTPSGRLLYTLMVLHHLLALSYFLPLCLLYSLLIAIFLLNSRLHKGRHCPEGWEATGREDGQMSDGECSVQTMGCFPVGIR